MRVSEGIMEMSKYDVISIFYLLVFVFMVEPECNCRPVRLGAWSNNKYNSH